MLELLRILFKRRALYHVVYYYEIKSTHMKISGKGEMPFKAYPKIKSFNDLDFLNNLIKDSLLKDLKIISKDEIVIVITNIIRLD